MALPWKRDMQRPQQNGKSIVQYARTRRKIRIISNRYVFMKMNLIQVCARRRLGL